MKLDQMKTMLIGLFVIVGIGLLVGVILFLEPASGNREQVLFVRFSNINGINSGTRVLFAGRAIGEVSAIETIPNARKQVINEMGDVYFYQLVLRIDSHIEVFNTDQVVVTTSGLLGEKSIEITPRIPPKGVIPQRVTDKTPIYAESIDTIESAFSQIHSLADTMEVAFAKLSDWIDENGGALGKAIRSFDGAMAEASAVLSDVRKSQVVEAAKAMIVSMTTTSNEIESTLKQMHQEKIFDNVAVTMEHAKNIATNFDIISKEITEGKGTIGHLVMDSDMYLEVNSILTKANALMNDVNHYGLLFNLNKEWQRTRLKRATLLNALQTPQEFRAYFENEVDSINTAMARLSVLIERAENGPEREAIIKSRLFRDDFANLMRKVDMMLNNLKLYNEQLEEASYEECQ